jgi:hypothetical protein
MAGASQTGNHFVATIGPLVRARHNRHRPVALDEVDLGLRKQPVALADVLGNCYLPLASDSHDMILLLFLKVRIRHDTEQWRADWRRPSKTASAADVESDELVFVTLCSGANRGRGTLTE